MPAYPVDLSQRYQQILDRGWTTSTEALLFEVLEKGAGQGKRPAVQEALCKLPHKDGKPDTSLLVAALQNKVDGLISFGI